jgi:hypothetical protein
VKGENPPSKTPFNPYYPSAPFHWKGSFVAIISFILLAVAIVLTVLTTISFFALGDEESASWEAILVAITWWLGTAIVQGLFVGL